MKFLLLLNFFVAITFAQYNAEPFICEADATYVNRQKFNENLLDLEKVSSFFNHKDEENITDEAVLKFKGEMDKIKKQWENIEKEISATIASLDKLDKSFTGRTKSLEIINQEQDRLVAKLEKKQKEAIKKYEVFTTKYKHQLADPYFQMLLTHKPIELCAEIRKDLERYDDRVFDADMEFRTLRMSFFRN